MWPPPEGFYIILFHTDTIGPLLFVLDEDPLQHKILIFGLFQAKTYANVF